MKYILGKKVGMTTLYDEKEGAQNVTLVECVSKVSLVRTQERDGYRALQIESPKTKRKKVLREFRIKNDEAVSFAEGDVIKVDIFQIGDIVDARGITKAKGFQGVMKRHDFSGSPHSHGHKHDWRAPGSIGSGFPEHVLKGKRMAGRMGGGFATVKNIEVVCIDSERNLIGLKGAVPGISGGIVEIYG